jgi:hypothetical protein
MPQATRALLQAMRQALVAEHLFFETTLPDFGKRLAISKYLAKCPVPLFENRSRHGVRASLPPMSFGGGRVPAEVPVGGSADQPP